MQYEIPLMAVINGPTKAPESVVAGFTSTTEAIRWGYQSRTNAGGKTVAWLAHHMGMQRQRLSRVLNHGDFKMDAARIHLWDCLVGNTAATQYIELERARINSAAAEVVNNAIKARFAA